MPANPLLSLQAQVPDVGQTFSNVLMNLEGFNNFKTQPVRNRALEANAQTAESNAFATKDFNRIKSVVNAAVQLNSLPERDRLQFAQNRRQELIDAGISTEDTDQFIAAMTSGDLRGAQTYLDDAIEAGQLMGLLKTQDQINPRTNRASAKSFAPITLINPETKEKRLVTPTFDPGTQQATLSEFDIPEGFELSTETPEEKRNAELLTNIKELKEKLQIRAEQEPDIARNTKEAEAAVATADKAFDQIDAINGNILNMRDVIDAIEDGAETGPLTSKLPSVREASIRLDNIQKRLGLDVIGSVTFGALSEGELQLALDTALPRNLDGPDLINWAQEKINAQEKLKGYLEEQALFLSNGGTRAEWLEKVKAKGQESKPTRIRFDAQGNLIQ